MGALEIGDWKLEQFTKLNCTGVKIQTKNNIKSIEFLVLNYFQRKLFWYRKNLLFYRSWKVQILKCKIKGWVGRDMRVIINYSKINSIVPGNPFGPNKAKPN